jgi:hypothetical protein
LIFIPGKALVFNPYEHPVLAHNRHTGSSITLSKSFKEWERSTKMNESAEGM